MRRALVAVSCVAICTTYGCDTEVTLSFFEPPTGAAAGDDAGGGNGGGMAAAGTNAGGADAGGADTGGANAAGTEAGGTDAGGAGPEVCQELGSELCNAADDDCNGQVDEGCDHTVFWRPEADGASLGHAAEGVAFTEVCPTGSILSGLRVGFGESSLNQVAAICSQVGVAAKTVKGTTTFTATIGPHITRALVPAVTEDPTNELADMLCPEGLVASMLEGDDDPTQHLVDLRIRCAPLRITEQPNGSFFFDLDLAQEQPVDALACSSCTAPTQFAFSSRVPPGLVARRIFGRVGALVTRLGFGLNAARVANL